MNTNNKIIHCILLGALALAINGCATFHPPFVYVKPDPTGTKQYPMDATLVVPEDLCKQKIVSKLHMGSEAYEYAVGTHLCEHVKDVAKACFRSVQVSTGSPASPSAIVLHPKLVKASHIMPLFHDQQMAFVVEWTVSEPGTGKTILLVTVQGNATAPMKGVNLGPGGATCIQLAEADLYKNTVFALTNSIEIQQYVAAKQK